MITENLSTLKIHKLSQAQYDRAVENGTIDENALYLTPDEDKDEVTAIENGGTGADNAEDALVNIGAAPAGYGLGGFRSSGDTITDWSLVNTLTNSGWYRFSCSVSAGGVTSNNAYMRVDAFDDRYATQNLYLIYNGTQYKLERNLRNGTWENEWSWVNPPLLKDVEYRTTELWNDKPVYTMRTEFHPEEEHVWLIDEYSDSPTILIRHCGYHSLLSLPYYSSQTNQVAKGFDVYRTAGEIVYFDTNPDEEATVYVQAWYIKSN